MPRPIQAKDAPANVAVICNLTEFFPVKEFNFGTFPVHPIIPGVQYIVRCQASLNREQNRDRKIQIVNPESGGAVKELIRRCEPGQEFALTEIQDSYAKRQEMGGPEGKNNTEVREKVDAYDIADDMVREWNDTILGADLVERYSKAARNSHIGIFVCDHDFPTAEELNANRRRLREYDEARVREADTSFAMYKSILFTMDAAASAKRLNIEDREWQSMYKPTKDCPMCFTKLDPRAKVCKQCNFILDEKAAIAAGYIKAVPEPEKPARVIPGN